MKSYRTVSLGIALLALVGGTPQGAADSELELVGKSLMIYPVAVDDSGNSQDFGFDVGMAEVIGMFLERAGMLPDVTSDAVPVAPADDLPAIEGKVREFQTGQEIGADLTLFVSIVSQRTDRGRIVAKACTVLTDREVNTVWSRQDTEFPDGPAASPMAACVHVVEVLCSVSDLEDYRREDAPQGAMHRRMAERSGVPPDEETQAMESRWETARGSMGKASLTVYPFHVWGSEKGSTKSAEALALKITEAGLSQASATKTDPHLEIQGDPNELRVLWDTARAFRSYLREHPADTDYALLVDASSPPRVHHLHLILCEGSGEWVMVDLQNSHHRDFQRIRPDSLEDCEQLAALRFQQRARESDPE